MRKITEEAVTHFYNGTTFKKSNTEVEVFPEVTILKLYGNEIAWLYNDPLKTLTITDAGWATNTTKERLNGLKGVSINQVKGSWYLNDELWDGSKIEI